MKLPDSMKGYLQGEHGEANRLATELLLKLGESFGARRFVPIGSAHILGHYGSLQQAGIDFLEKLAGAGGRCSVPTTVDPSSVDFERCAQFRIPQEYAAKQARLKAAVEQLGVTPSWSCTPYLEHNIPEFGQNIAWAESSAVVYANSVIGARTNRTPFGMDVCAALTGMIPEFGLYLDQNRVGSLLFKVKAGDLSDLDYHTLGALVGQKCGARIPVIEGLPPSSSSDQLKCFGAGCASAGAVALYHLPGITPEARATDPFDGKRPQHVFPVSRKDIREMEEAISTAGPDERVDMVTLGCPLLSIAELKSVFSKMQNRQVSHGMHFWIYLTRPTYDAAKEQGLIRPLETAGIWFAVQTCATISPVKTWGFSRIMTNSAKCALVVPSEHDVQVAYRDTDTCILTATEPA